MLGGRRQSMLVWRKMVYSLFNFFEPNMKKKAELSFFSPHRVIILKLKSCFRLYQHCHLIPLPNSELLPGQILNWPQGPLSNTDANPPFSDGISFQLSLYFWWNGSLTAVERETHAHREKLLRALCGLLLSGVFLTH